MSAASKQRLLEIWKNLDSGKHLREHAFRLWAASNADGDLAILRHVSQEDPLWPRALFSRLMRGDHSAIPALEQKLLEGHEFYWWQTGRYIWSDRLTTALDASLTRRGAKVERTWDQKCPDLDWITSEMLTRLPVSEAEALLLKHWEHVRYSPLFIHAALHTATPALTPLIAKTMAECPTPAEAMKHVDHHYGIRQKGHRLTRLAQVEALVPYFGFMSEFAIASFADSCNDQGWFNFRRKHLDSLLKDTRYVTYLSENSIFESLDREAERSIRSMDWWVKKYLEFGASIDEVMTTLQKWLSSRRTISALLMVGDAVTQFGHRRHIGILEHAIEPASEADNIISDTRFAVRQRTLI